MIFSLETSHDGRVVILESENCRAGADEIYDLLAAAFPHPSFSYAFKGGRIGCFNGYENCIVFDKD